MMPNPVQRVRHAKGSVTCEDFFAHLASGQFIFRPTREFWPAASVNAILPKLEGTKASDWLACNRAVHQITWAPGEGEIINGRLCDNGGWVSRAGVSVFNLYQPAADLEGDPALAGPWLELVKRVYPEESEHLLDWFAHRVQRPGEKCNHALVLGGDQGIGKDSLLEPVKAAVGAWNFHEVAPSALMGRFNGFLKAIILRVSEARDLGDHDRFAFYDRLKTVIAAPPDVHRIDEKNRQEYAVFNVCGVIITTNRKDALHLEADDRRHFVAWSGLTKDDFELDYWPRFWSWLERGGRGHVQAYLKARDLRRFDPKAPPPKTAAFKAVLAAAMSPEAGEAADAFERLGWPDAVTVGDVQNVASSDFALWLLDRRNRRTIPHRFADAGYVIRHNPNSSDGRWKVNGSNTTVYVKKSLTEVQRSEAVRRRIERGQP